MLLCRLPFLHRDSGRGQYKVSASGVLALGERVSIYRPGPKRPAKEAREAIQSVRYVTDSLVGIEVTLI